MTTIIRTLLKFGLGISGVSALFFFMLMKQWLSVPAFEALTPDQTFYALIASLIAILLFFVILITTGSSSKSNVATTSGSGHAVVTTGKNSKVDIGK
ncbi:TPA: hypothetical protein NJ348_001091 [Vibrio parahaemolyticus]|nr:MULTISPECIES: hypothetical protein [Vibrio harveyi group]KIT43690.1 hypothetical protein H320_12930 [Vibrio parahaemolyticus 49]EGQ8730639.1 hypothetical protein [Vibrio parahaemolyticus]EGQ8887128.1 hypothetical protein [Vibrio parahaemolyticus]EGQ8913329.1 hypothetical protein [Vibrio parahaemolyticus]EGQ8933044.1 hypothetical protein [Vibrio parahaemolyticus]